MRVDERSTMGLALYLTPGNPSPQLVSNLPGGGEAHILHYQRVFCVNMAVCSAVKYSNNFLFPSYDHLL